MADVGRGHGGGDHGGAAAADGGAPPWLFCNLCFRDGQANSATSPLNVSTCGHTICVACLGAGTSKLARMHLPSRGALIRSSICAYCVYGSSAPYGARRVSVPGLHGPVVDAPHRWQGTYDRVRPTMHTGRSCTCIITRPEPQLPWDVGRFFADPAALLGEMAEVIKVCPHGPCQTTSPNASHPPSLIHAQACA